MLWPVFLSCWSENRISKSRDQLGAVAAIQAEGSKKSPRRWGGEVRSAVLAVLWSQRQHSVLPGGMWNVSKKARADSEISLWAVAYGHSFLFREGLWRSFAEKEGIKGWALGFTHIRGQTETFLEFFGAYAPFLSCSHISGWTLKNVSLMAQPSTF